MRIEMVASFIGKNGKHYTQGQSFPPPFDDHLQECIDEKRDHLVKVIGSALIDREVLFRDFSSLFPEPNRQVYLQERPNVKPEPWFKNQKGAKAKRALLLRKFD